MIFERIIREALTPEKPSGVPVRAYVRRPNLKRQAVIEELSALHASRSVPTCGPAA